MVNGPWQILVRDLRQQIEDDRHKTCISIERGRDRQEAWHEHHLRIADIQRTLDHMIWSAGRLAALTAPPPFVIED